MSANLNIENGVVSFMGTKTAWHKLGQIVDSAQTSEEAIRLAGLDFGVTKRPVYTNGGQDNLLMIPDKFATVRMDNDTPLGVVGARYTILQNRDAFKFIDTIVGSKEAIFESAGALGKGERIFITCKLPEKLVVGLDDVADLYFFITNSHDGSGSVEIAFTPTFIVCANTLKMALGNAKRKQRVRHTTGVNSGLLKAADLMGITRETIAEKQELFNALTKVQITDRQLRSYIEKVMGTPEKEQVDREEWSSRFVNQVEKIYAYGLGDPAQRIAEREGTLWGAVNAISGFYNNVADYSAEEKVKSVMYGSGKTHIDKAFSLATDILSGKASLS